MPESTQEWIESTRPGTVYKVFEQHKKNELSYEGKLPVYVVPEVKVNKNKLKYGGLSYNKEADEN